MFSVFNRQNSRSQGAFPGFIDIMLDIRRIAPQVDAVLVTHGDMEHCGALAYAMTRVSHLCAASIARCGFVEFQALARMRVCSERVRVVSGSASCIAAWA
jgi:hypothetical protein